jgi:hypothetical protein
MDRSCGIDLQRWRKCGDLFGFDLEAGRDGASKHSWYRDGWGVLKLSWMECTYVK